MADPPAPTEAVARTPYGSAFTRDGKVFLREHGQVRTIGEKDFDAAMRTGRYELASPQEVQEVDRKRRLRQFSQEEGVAGTAQAFAEGAARSTLDTLTLAPRLAGADVPTGGEILERIGGKEYGERQRMRAEGSPIASALGALAPEAIGLAASGGTATALKAGGKAALKRMGKAAAADVVLGAAAGGQQVTEQAWRTQTPVDSERLLANVGVGAMFSMGVGAVGLGASRAFAAAGGRQALQRAAFTGQQALATGLEGAATASRLADVASRAAGGLRRPGLSEGLGAVARGLRTKGDDAVVASMARKQRKVQDTFVARRKAQDKLGDQIKKLDKQQKKLDVGLRKYVADHADDAQKVWAANTAKVEAARVAGRRAVESASEGVRRADVRVAETKLKYDNLVADQERQFVTRSEAIDPLMDEVSTLRSQVKAAEESVENEHVQLVQAELDFATQSGFWFDFAEIDMEAI